MQTLVKFALVGAAIALPSTAMAAELVTNGSFETGDFTGFTLTGNTGFTGVSGTFSGIAPTDGNSQAYFGAVGSTGTLSQTLTTTAGQNYTFSFDLASFGGTPNSFSVAFNGTELVGGTDVGAFPYTSFSFGVVGTGSDTISFTIRQDPSFFLLDNISVAGVPEPATWSLMIMGFGAVGVAMRRRKAFTALTA